MILPVYPDVPLLLLRTCSHFDDYLQRPPAPSDSWLLAKLLPCRTTATAHKKFKALSFQPVRQINLVVIAIVAETFFALEFIRCSTPRTSETTSCTSTFFCRHLRGNGSKLLRRLLSVFRNGTHSDEAKVFVEGNRVVCSLDDYKLILARLLELL